jgi:hypothetical protein
LKLFDGHTEEGANDGAVTSLQVSREKNASGRTLTQREKSVNDLNDASESDQLQDPVSTCDSGRTVEIIIPHTPTPSLPEALDDDKERLAEAQVTSWRRKDDGESEMLSLEEMNGVCGPTEDEANVARCFKKKRILIKEGDQVCVKLPDNRSRQPKFFQTMKCVHLPCEATGNNASLTQQRWIARMTKYIMMTRSKQ